MGIINNRSPNKPDVNNEVFNIENTSSPFIPPTILISLAIKSLSPNVSSNVSLKTKKTILLSLLNDTIGSLKKTCTLVKCIIFNVKGEIKNEKEVFKHNFISIYQNKMKNFAHLYLEEEELNKKLDEYLSLSENFELNPDFEKIFNKILFINKNLENQTIKEDVYLIKNIVNDLLIFSITPLKISETQKGYIQRQSIEITSPLILDRIIGSLFTYSDISSNPYLSHIPTNYPALSIYDRMISINLSNMDEKGKNKLTNDPFYQEFLKLTKEQNNLDKWMFACSGALEQNYLNTCTSAALCQEITSALILLPQAIFLTENTLVDLERKFEQKKTTFDQTNLRYLKKRIEINKKAIVELKKDILERMKSPPISEEEMHDFTIKWSQITQKIGLLVDFSDVGHPTKKPISNHWLLSVLLMFPVVLFEHLIRKSGNPPSMKMRTSGASYVLPNGFSKDRIISLSGIEKKVEISSFWKTVNRNGGGSYCNETHTFYLKAVVYKGKQVFLVGDPKQKDYKIFSFKDFINSSYVE